MLTKEMRGVLMFAKKVLHEGEIIYLCNVFRRCHDLTSSAQVRTACKQLLEYVEIQLDGARTLGDWQIQNGFGERSVLQQRADRMNWINWLLESNHETVKLSKNVDHHVSKGVDCCPNEAQVGGSK